MDYAGLRAAALRSGEDEEAVTVDTRALIDKVLARYSGEWTTLRELIQNAADAQATSVSVRWETMPSVQVPLPSTPTRSDLLKHTLCNHTLRRLIVQNDGQPFTKTDWARLKRIAEGNPDETKIGAFGVGFYSVFADCEEPFVSSGSEAMAFYWKGNSLFTRKSQLPPEQVSRNTAFVLDYRNSTTPLPNLLSVSQFLATSLTFVALQNIDFYIDDYRILSLRKLSSPSAELSLPRDLDARTKEGLMSVTGVARTSTQIDASYMSVVGWKPLAMPSVVKTPDAFVSTEAPSLRSFFSRLATSASSSGSKSKAQVDDSVVQPQIAEDVTKLNTSTVFLQTTSAAVKTNVSASFAAELERATKKPPPKMTKLAILTASYDETQDSQPSSADDAFSRATDVFASVLPTKKPGGRIFIGFPTMQTTGAGMHISAPSVIPTVEREAIDLNARWVRTWNVELLRAAGIVTRLAYSNAMDDLEKRLRGLVAPGAKLSRDHVAKLIPEALHLLKTFSFADSTPSAQVGQIVEEAFWTCFKKASIEMYSSRGVLSTTQVRLGSDELTPFIDGIPVVPEELRAAPFVIKLTEFGLISTISITDMKRELEAKALTKQQAISFIGWAGRKSLTRELDPGSRDALLDVAVATVGDGEDGDQGEVIALASVCNFPDTSRVPSNMPMPPTTIPFVLTTGSRHSEMQALSWEPLGVLAWLRFLLSSALFRPEETNMTKSSKFAVQVLTVLSKAWDHVSSKDRDAIVLLLKDKAVMPTKAGMKLPGESFFPTVKLFDDLPVIQGCDKVKDKFLVALGVRKTVDLDTIFTRLLSVSGDSGGHNKWSHMELIKYLASVEKDIPSADLKKLKESKICPAEAGPKGMEPTQGTKAMYKVSELFEPKDTLRALRFPILQWPGPPGSFRPRSPEGRFLALLGLRTSPSVPELVDLMASPDGGLRTSAMTYFIANHHLNGYAAFNLGDTPKAILPVQGGSKLVTPASCYTNERAAVLGFDILRRDLHDHANKFCVARDPPMTECVNRLLANPPKDQQDASKLFGYFASRLADVRENSLARLRTARIVPVNSPKGAQTSEKTAGSVSYIDPSHTYLGKSAIYGDIFDFVDFGQEANAFLFHCGAKHEPTKEELAFMMCREPARMLNVTGADKYLNLLKSLADTSSTLKKNRELWQMMKTNPRLLAYKEIAAGSKGKLKDKLIDLDDDDDDVEEAMIKQYQLARPGQVAVLDDIISYRLFKEQLLCAPEEDALEIFYLQLGGERLSSIVQEDVRIGNQTGNHQSAEKLRKHVLERSKIFLYEYANYRRDGIKNDSKWLEKNLGVQMVRTVSLRRSLRGHQQHTNTQKRSAAVKQVLGHWILYVADHGRPDMYQVGQAICPLLLERPSQQANLFFEPFLTLDLLGLRARGYNVDRILRAKAAEARVAEEQRQKALEEEQRMLQELAESEAQKRAQAAIEPPGAAEAARQVAKDSGKAVMPGGWDPPEGSVGESPSPLSSKRKSGGFFAQIGRRLGFDDFLDNRRRRPSEQIAAGPSGGHVGGSDHRSSDDGANKGGQTSSVQEQKQHEPEEKVTSPTVLRQNLLNAIKSTRPHGSNSVFSAPSVTQVKEQATYCDKTTANNIVFVAEAANGMQVYLGKDMVRDMSRFMADNAHAIHLFAWLLTEVADVFSLAPSVMHIFHDGSPEKIAFNLDGSIFCNLKFFVEMHMYGEAINRNEALTWWWVVVAHELAHNLVGPHNAQHSFYTESFIQQYTHRVFTKIMTWTLETDDEDGEDGDGDAAAAAAAVHSSSPPALPRREFARQETAPPPYTQMPRGS